MMRVTIIQSPYCYKNNKHIKASLKQLINVWATSIIQYIFIYVFLYKNMFASFKDENK